MFCNIFIFCKNFVRPADLRGPPGPRGPRPPARIGSKASWQISFKPHGCDYTRVVASWVVKNILWANVPLYTYRNAQRYRECTVRCTYHRYDIYYYYFFTYCTCTYSTVVTDLQNRATSLFCIMRHTTWDENISRIISWPHPCAVLCTHTSVPYPGTVYTVVVPGTAL